MKDQKAKKSKPLTPSVQKAKDDWDKKSNGGDIVVGFDPITSTSVVFTKIIFEENRVCIWTSGYEDDEPEYVIVNPPSQYVSEGSPVEDPITALAVSIARTKK